MVILNQFARWWDRYRDTGKTCLGRGMHCSGAFSCICLKQQQCSVVKMIYSQLVESLLAV